MPTQEEAFMQPPLVENIEERIRSLLKGISRVGRRSILPNTIKSRLLFGATLEVHYRLTDQHRYTTVATFVYHGPDNAVTGTPDPIMIQINSDDYKNVDLYLEANFSGQGDAYCEARLYNVTDEKAVLNSNIVSPTGSVPDRVRSDKLILDSGIKEYAIQYRRVGGILDTDYPGIYEAHLVVRFV